MNDVVNLGELITLDRITAARRRLDGIALRTPLVRLNLNEGPEIWLKLENLQPVGSFKIRGAGSAITASHPDELRHGVYTASAGNMAQGVAWMARRLGIPCTVVVPENAPQAKLEAITRLGARWLRVPFDEWWQTLVRRGYPGLDGRFVHPVSDAEVIAGNGTIGLELLEDLPDVDVVFAPYGGGGLSCGIAAAMRALKPDVRIVACEPATAAPLTASLAAGTPTPVARTASFVDGCGSQSVLAEMWPLASTLLSGAVAIAIPEIAAAVRLLAERNKVVAEGAGAVAVAAALRHAAPGEKIVCIVSGGHIDAAVLATILTGGNP